MLQNFRNSFSIPFSELKIFNQEKLGFGMLGSVYLARWKGLLVAVKKMHSLKGPGADSYTEGNRREIVGEAEKMSLFRHPHIVDFYGISHEPEDDIYYLVLKREEGDLRKRIEGILKGEKQTITLENKLRISLCISRALQYLQSKGVVHRDLRPGNILLCWYFENGRRVLGAKICDFGLTRIVDVMTNMNKGVPYFIAPENRLSQRKNPTFECDIYSLGMCLWCIFKVNLPDLLGAEDRFFESEYDHSVKGVVLQMAKKCCSNDQQNRCEIEDVIRTLDMLLQEEKVKNEKMRLQEKEVEKRRRVEMERKLKKLKILEKKVTAMEENEMKIEHNMKLLKVELGKKDQEFEVEKTELDKTWRRRLEYIRNAKREAETRQRMNTELQSGSNGEKVEQLSEEKQSMTHQEFENLKNFLHREALEEQERIKQELGEKNREIEYINAEKQSFVKVINDMKHEHEALAKENQALREKTEQLAQEKVYELEFQLAKLVEKLTEKDLALMREVNVKREWMQLAKETKTELQKLKKKFEPEADKALGNGCLVM